MKQTLLCENLICSKSCTFILSLRAIHVSVSGRDGNLPARKTQRFAPTNVKTNQIFFSRNSLTKSQTTKWCALEALYRASVCVLARLLRQAKLLGVLWQWAWNVCFSAAGKWRRLAFARSSFQEAMLRTAHYSAFRLSSGRFWAIVCIQLKNHATGFEFSLIASTQLRAKFAQAQANCQK